MEDNIILNDQDIERLSKGTINIMNSDLYKKITDKTGKDIDKTVLNLDNEGNGTHWTSIQPIEKDVLYYEDSFGVRPPFSLKDKIVFYNTEKKQEDSEVNCGARALNSLR